MPRIRVITFDLDDTLWDVRAVVGNADKKMREYLNAAAPGAAALFAAGGAQSIRERVLRETPTLAHDISLLRETIVREVLLATGTPTDDAPHLAREAFETFLAARHEVVYFEHALATLGALRSRFTMGALSNGNADPARLGLDRFFSFSFSASQVGASKPAPAMFRAALEHTGASPGAAIHVGDHLTDDVAGAAAVGMHTIWFNRAGHAPGEIAATREVSRFDQLIDAVAAIELA